MAAREFVADVWKEARQASRMLLRTPGHTAAIVGLLALGIGANAAMFSLVNALFVRELPVREPRQLVAVNPGWSNPLFEDFRKAQRSFSGVMATGSMLGTVVANERGEQIDGVTGGLATGNYFQVLGVGAALGRVFTEDDDRFADAQAVMVITDAFWRRQFGGDRGVLGKRLYLSGTPFTIIGVTARTFSGDSPGRARDFWVPMNTQPVANPQGDLRRNRGYRWLSAMGRLRAGVSMEQAQAEAEIVLEQIAPLAAGQARPSQPRIRLEAAHRGFAGTRRQLGTQLQILAATVAIVLLIVWANVATLLLARGAGRQREIAVRKALGCSGARLMRQFLLEGLTLASAGGAIGLALAPSAAHALVLTQPTFGTIDLDLSLDGNMLLFGVGVSVLTAIAFSLAPAVGALRGAIEPELKSGSRGSAGGRQAAIRTVIAVQAALSVVLVTASFLFGQSMARLHGAKTGFDREHIISVTVNSRFAGYRDGAAQAQLSERLLERISGVPGVKSASASLCAVVMGCSRMAAVSVEGREAEAGAPGVWINPVSPNYFDTIGAPLVMGRNFGPQDRPSSPHVAVVTEAMARHYFPGANPLGRHFSERGSADSIEIVGVVRDVNFVSPRDAPIRMAFLSQAQVPGAFSYLQVRTEGAPERLVPAVRRAILEVDPKLHLLGPDPLSKVLDQILARDLLLSRASGLFGAIGLVLACCGVYGVIAYLVSARTTELGIRLALGAQPREIIRQVVINAVLTIVPGVAVGIAGAWVLARYVESLLFGVTGRDPATYAIVGPALLLTGAAAALWPAIRASRIDPLAALRAE